MCLKSKQSRVYYCWSNEAMSKKMNLFNTKTTYFCMHNNVHVLFICFDQRVKEKGDILF